MLLYLKSHMHDMHYGEDKTTTVWFILPECLSRQLHLAGFHEIWRNHMFINRVLYSQVLHSWFSRYICYNNCCLEPAGWQVRDHDIQRSSRTSSLPRYKFYRVDYIALILPYCTGLVFFVMIWVRERDHISGHSMLTIRKTGIDTYITVHSFR